MELTMDQYIIDYEFLYKNGSRKNFRLALDPNTVTLLNFGQSERPSWARLTYTQCICCPLLESDQPYCPIAVNISELVEHFKEMVSYEVCEVRCIKPERTYLKETSIQTGLYSILGIVMATSNCPVMDFYKPLARFHLPFSTLEETIFRMAASYLLKQYFEYKNGQKPDLDMRHMIDTLKKVEQVNAGILKRIKRIAVEDAQNNALIVLNSFCQMFTMEIEESLISIEYLFNSKN